MAQYIPIEGADQSLLALQHRAGLRLHIRCLHLTRDGVLLLGESRLLKAKSSTARLATNDRPGMAGLGVIKVTSVAAGTPSNHS